MKAIIYTKYGGPEVLELKEIAKPVPKENEVLIRVSTVSINDWDWGLLQGDFINRLMYGLRKPGKQILGSDIAGRVESVGKHVKKFQPGDDVYGDLSGHWGGMAEYVCADEKLLALKPASMSYAEAAAIPQAGMLAVQGLIDVGQIKQGQKVLINGAGGGVGTYAVQIAKLFGAEVTGVDHASKFEMMRSIGFDHVIDYKKEDFTRNGKTYDLIFDAKTNRSPFAYTRSLRTNGVYATVGGSIAKLLQIVLLKSIISLFWKKYLRIVVLKPNKDLDYVNQLFESGKLRSVIDGPYKLADVPEAFRLFARGEHKGKIVIEVV